MILPGSAFCVTTIAYRSCRDVNVTIPSPIFNLLQVREDLAKAVVQGDMLSRWRKWSGRHGKGDLSRGVMLYPVAEGSPQ